MLFSTLFIFSLILSDGFSKSSLKICFGSSRGTLCSLGFLLTSESFGFLSPTVCYLTFEVVRFLGKWIEIGLPKVSIAALSLFLLFPFSSILVEKVLEDVSERRSSCSYNCRDTPDGPASPPGETLLAWTRFFPHHSYLWILSRTFIRMHRVRMKEEFVSKELLVSIFLERWGKDVTTKLSDLQARNTWETGIMKIPRFLG